MNEKKINITREFVINIFFTNWQGIRPINWQLLSEKRNGWKAILILLMKEKRNEYTKKKMEYYDN